MANPEYDRQRILTNFSDAFEQISVTGFSSSRDDELLRSLSPYFEGNAKVKNSLQGPYRQACHEFGEVGVPKLVDLWNSEEAQIKRSPELRRKHAEKVLASIQNTGATEAKDTELLINIKKYYEYTGEDGKMLEGTDITSYNLLKRAHTEAIYYYGESNIKPLLDAMFTQEE